MRFSFAFFNWSAEKNLSANILISEICLNIRGKVQRLHTSFEKVKKKTKTIKKIAPPQKKIAQGREPQFCFNGKFGVLSLFLFFIFFNFFF